VSLNNAQTSPIQLPVAVFDFREDSRSVADNDTFWAELNHSESQALPALLDMLNVPTISP
jgi:hypothetical protein